jgi:hypothetical protein
MNLKSAVSTTQPLRVVVVPGEVALGKLEAHSCGLARVEAYPAEAFGPHHQPMRRACRAHVVPSVAVHALSHERGTGLGTGDG